MYVFIVPTDARPVIVAPCALVVMAPISFKMICA